MTLLCTSYIFKRHYVTWGFRYFCSKHFFIHLFSVQITSPSQSNIFMYYIWICRERKYLKTAHSVGVGNYYCFKWCFVKKQSTIGTLSAVTLVKEYKKILGCCVTINFRPMGFVSPRFLTMTSSRCCKSALRVKCTCLAQLPNFWDTWLLDWRNLLLKRLSENCKFD